VLCSNCQIGKKKIVDCIVRTVADVAGPYDDVVGPYADVARLSWWTVGSWVVESFLDTWHVFGKWDGATWPRHGLPCRTVFGLVIQNLLESAGLDPTTFGQGKRFGKGHPTDAPPM
jgi:hypothetical protein